jgi:glycosyltransferase involved in cell wall biosynthesis
LKILILTQYFPPEVGAPQNRLFELAVFLQKKGADVTILTAMPNYPQMQVYEGYKNKFYHYEEVDGLKIHRSWVYVSNSKGVLKRLLSYFSFVMSSALVGLFKLPKFDYVLCESPPLFLGITALLLKKTKGAQLIFNVSDLWPESAEKLGVIQNRFLLGLTTKLEEGLYKHSDLITGQTQGICNSISIRFPDKKVHWFPNGADLSYFNPQTDGSEWRKQNNFKQTDFILLYAGIIGHAQGLDVILKAAEKLKSHQDIKFVIVGSGPQKEELLQQKSTLKSDNVFFFDTLPKAAMPGIIAAADVSIIPLKKLNLFKGAIPSKIFESLAMKKPILLGVDGEAKALFIDEGKCGLAFTPENAADLADKTMELYSKPNERILLGENGYNYVKEKFDRMLIQERIWELIIGHISS